ncbi:hypothetical protein D3C81_1394630 [compost metagenome]
MVRPRSMLLRMAAFSYSINRLGSQLSRLSWMRRAQPVGRSCATPPMRNQAGCMRAPVMASMMV